MRKISIGCCSVFVLFFIILVIKLFILENPVEKRINDEIDAVYESFDASRDNHSGLNAPIGGRDRGDSIFNLEKTIRLFHILDDGLNKARNMQEYLQFLAQQDYYGIPREVIDAKKKIIPYYKSLRKSEEALDEVEKNSLWQAIVNTESLTSPSSPLASAVMFAASGGLDLASLARFTTQGVAAGKSVYENLKANEGLKKEARKALEENQDAYIEYLEEYSAIYIKYLSQWNRLCLVRDQAYLAINNGDITGAISTLNEVLEEFPGDMEAALLKAFCLLIEAQHGSNVAIEYNYVGEAKHILDTFIQNNPEKSAPALVLLGSYYSMTGDEIKAKTLFDQSSVEYPRQAESLLDMYNSYNYRNYLQKSVEGHFVQKMYKAMMEGYGFFSPNFQKALNAYGKGDFNKAKEEVLMHFFRRGNQEIYDYLISDMKYVEEYMPFLLNMIFEEHSFLDLQTYNPTLSFSDKLAVEIENRSDKRLSNVRLFICLHLVDMYKDEYLVKKMENTINNIEPHSKVNFGKLQLNYELYRKTKNSTNDIVSARAIIMTDSLIIWVDQDKIKRSNISEKLVANAVTRQKFENIKSFFHLHNNVTGKDIVDQINSNCSYEIKQDEGFLSGVIGGGKQVVFHFPRILDGINPYFSFGELNKVDVIFPKSVVLNGNTIDVEFNLNNRFKSNKLPLYISCTEGVFHMDVSFDENGNVKEMSPVKF